MITLDKDWPPLLQHCYSQQQRLLSNPYGCKNRFVDTAIDGDGRIIMRRTVNRRIPVLHDQRFLLPEPLHLPPCPPPNPLRRRQSRLERGEVDAAAAGSRIGGVEMMR